MQKEIAFCIGQVYIQAIGNVTSSGAKNPRGDWFLLPDIEQRVRLRTLHFERTEVSQKGEKEGKENRDERKWGIITSFRIAFKIWNRVFFKRSVCIC